MKVYYSGNNEEMPPYKLFKRMISDNLILEKGEIECLTILERKANSNEGNALDGRVRVSDTLRVSRGLNIGGNPIGTGWKNYVSFLEEMECKKSGSLYQLDSLIGKEVYFVVTQPPFSNFQGIITPKGFDEFYEKLFLTH